MSMGHCLHFPAWWSPSQEFRLRRMYQYVWLRTCVSGVYRALKPGEVTTTKVDEGKLPWVGRPPLTHVLQMSRAAAVSRCGMFVRALVGGRVSDSFVLSLAGPANLASWCSRLQIAEMSTESRGRTSLLHSSSPRPRTYLQGPPRERSECARSRCGKDDRSAKIPCDIMYLRAESAL